MSPGIGLAVDPRPLLAAARTTPEKVRAAMAVVRAQGLRVLQGDYGVVPTGQGWELDRFKRPRGVSPLGAVVLAYQPDPGADMADPAAHVLGVPVAWVEGVSDGFIGEPTGFWLSHVDRWAYLAGLTLGYELLFELTTSCGCGTRYLTDEPGGCGHCAREERR